MMCKKVNHSLWKGEKTMNTDLNAKTDMKNVIVVKHPLCEHNLGVIRDKDINSDGFKNSMKRLATILILEATKNLPLKEYNIQTPIKECYVNKISDEFKIIFAPILRAGLAISDVASEIVPDASIQHVGMYRDETTLEPVWYYDKTPVKYEDPQHVKVFILDPMLATGNSAHAAISLFLKKGILIENLVFVSILSAPEGIKLITNDFPDLKIVTAKIDERLNERGYIVPGLGDAGDRLFNTFEK